MFVSLLSPGGGTSQVTLPVHLKWNLLPNLQKAHGGASPRTGQVAQLMRGSCRCPRLGGGKNAEEPEVVLEKSPRVVRRGFGGCAFGWSLTQDSQDSHGPPSLPSSLIPPASLLATSLQLPFVQTCHVLMFQLETLLYLFLFLLISKACFLLICHIFP